MILLDSFIASCEDYLIFHSKHMIIKFIHDSGV